MNASALESRLRHRGRRLVTAVVQQVPERVVAPLRHSFSRTDPSSLSHRLHNRALRVIRFRGVPSEVRSFTLADNPSISLVNADSFIVEWVYWFGERYGYEPGTVYWWRKFCATSASILELGANIGYATVQGAKVAPQARYRAVEPHPGCAEVCRQNLDLNGIENVEVVEAAAVAGPASEPVTLMLPGGRDHYHEAPATGFVGYNELHRRDEDMSSYTAVTVESVDLRQLLDQEPDLIKMDVEGQEHSLLSSIEEYLRDARPTIFLELLDDTPKLRALIVDVLLPEGYRAYVPTPGELVPLESTDLGSLSVLQAYNTRDIVLTCRDPSGFRGA